MINAETCLAWGIVENEPVLILTKDGWMVNNERLYRTQDGGSTSEVSKIFKKVLLKIIILFYNKNIKALFFYKIVRY